MFGISPFELLIILLVGVMVLGPEKLPKVMRTVTKWLSEFRRISTDVQRTINAEINLEEINRQHKREREEFGVKFIKDEAPGKTETRMADESAAEAASAPAQTTAGRPGADSEAPSPADFATGAAPVQNEGPDAAHDSERMGGQTEGQTNELTENKTGSGREEA